MAVPRLLDRHCFHDAVQTRSALLPQEGGKVISNYRIFVGETRSTCKLSRSRLLSFFLIHGGPDGLERSKIRNSEAHQPEQTDASPRSGAPHIAECLTASAPSMPLASR